MLINPNEALDMQATWNKKFLNAPSERRKTLESMVT